MKLYKINSFNKNYKNSFLRKISNSNFNNNNNNNNNNKMLLNNLNNLNKKYKFNKYYHTNNILLDNIYKFYHFIECDFNFDFEISQSKNNKYELNNYGEIDNNLFYFTFLNRDQEKFIAQRKFEAFYKGFFINYYKKLTYVVCNEENLTWESLNDPVNRVEILVSNNINNIYKD
jgi:hypothetical protein